MRFDISFLPALGAAFFLLFARVGTMIMLLPGLGESSVPTQLRLTAALLLTAVLFPLHRAGYQIDLKSFYPVLTMLAEELLVGALLGLTARLAIAGLEVAGSVIAQQLGLGFVTAVDPTQNQQGVIIGNFLMILGITLIFVTDLHYLIIQALDDSFVIFRPGEVPLTGDMAAHITQIIAGMFRISVQISAPFLVFGLVFNVALGLLSRLMPQMQVFFIGMPMTILGGTMIFLMVVGAMMTTYLAYLGNILHDLAPHG
jgi:flagellar biosynthetic protein FliR